MLYGRSERTFKYAHLLGHLEPQAAKQIREVPLLLRHLLLRQLLLRLLLLPILRQKMMMPLLYLVISRNEFKRQWIT
jgi:hypothetical protein